MSRNQQLFERAQRSIPGGVNSPVRAFRHVGGTPRFFVSGDGAHVVDADGQRFIDYIGSWGPMIVGHAHPEVVEAVTRAAASSLSFGAPTEAEIEIAEAVIRLVPSMQRVRFVSSGTEATMSAIRLARGATGRARIVKFDGCYHGHADSLLVKAGSGLLTFGNPTSAGVPPAFAELTTVLPFNDLEALDDCFAQLGAEIACVIVEPVAGNMNLVRGNPQWLARMRELCTRHGAVLIWDEVMSGFRVALGGAQALYGIEPDLTTLGKVIGGGLPVAAFGGKESIMRMLAPEGPVYQAGTLSGNPVAVAAGLATLAIIERPGFFEQLAASTQVLASGLRGVAHAAGIALASDSVGGMFGFFFASALPDRLSVVSTSDIDAFKQFFHLMLERGVYLAPSAYEAGFVSAAHTDTVIATTIDAAADAFEIMKVDRQQATLP